MARPPCPRALLTIASLLIAGAGARADNPPCNLKRLASLDMTVSPGGALMVPILLDDKPAALAVDTGAVWSVLRTGVADAWSRHEAERAIIGAGGVPTRSFVTVPKLTLEHLTLNNVDFYVEPDSLSPDASVAGNLAANLLSLEDLEIDPGSRKAALYTKDHCPGKVVYWPHDDLVALPFQSTEAGMIEIPVHLDGKAVTALVDTGAAISILDAGVASRLFDLSPGNPGVDLAGQAATLDGGRLPLYRHQFQNLSFGAITFQHPWLTIAEHRRPASGGPGSGGWTTHRVPDLVLGMHQLRALHLYIAYDERMLYATTVAGDEAASANHSDPVAPPRVGVQADLFDYATAKQAADRAADAMKHGQMAEAIAVLDGAIEATPQLSLLYVERANAYRLERKPAAAVDDFGHALALSPGDPAILNGLGFARLDMADWPGAIADFDAALTAKPADAGALYGRGVARQRAGNASEAASDLAAAQHLDPNAAQHYPLF